MRVEEFEDGFALLADSTDPRTLEEIARLAGGPIPLIVADPPYGNIVDERWDRVECSDDEFARWMLGWTRAYERLLAPGGAMYVWGGVGTVGFRPFFKYLSLAERSSEFELANLITWSKKRAYGVQTNYLFTREECAYFVKGDAKKPRTFNVPLLETKRGYAGFDKEFPAKSEFYRRTNVWTDVTEIMRGKLHPTQKQQRLHEIMIEVHTGSNELVLDPFAGAATTAFAARKLGRRFLIVEKDEGYFEDATKRLRGI